MTTRLDAQVQGHLPLRPSHRPPSGRAILGSRLRFGSQGLTDTVMMTVVPIRPGALQTSLLAPRQHGTPPRAPSHRELAAQRSAAGRADPQRARPQGSALLLTLWGGSAPIHACTPTPQTRKLARALPQHLPESPRPPQVPAELRPGRSQMVLCRLPWLTGSPVLGTAVSRICGSERGFQF